MCVSLFVRSNTNQLNTRKKIYLNSMKSGVCGSESLVLSLLVFKRYEDSEDEMEPEMEEAFESFCLESERKRQQ